MNIRTVCTGLFLALSVSLALPVAAADSRDNLNRHLTIRNRSGQTVMEMHVTNVGNTRWGRDELGDDVILDGDNDEWNIDDGSGYCRYDFKFVLEDGTARFKYNYNVCAQSYLTVVN